MQKPTMTVHECCEAFRANNISIGENTLIALINEGKVPFAVGVMRDKSCNIIFRPAFYKYLKEMLGKENIIEI